MTKELSALISKLVSLQHTKLELLRVQRSDHKVEEEIIATLTKRRAELDAIAREIDRASTDLSQADTSFVQKLIPPPPPSQ